LWLTFEPAYRRLSSALTESSSGLMPGDPAATLDALTGKLDWKTVNNFENVQVGHHHLMRGELSEAERIYRNARPHLSPREQRELLVFEWLLLKRQGKNEEARAKLAEFQSHTVPMVVDANGFSFPRAVPGAGFIGGAASTSLLGRNFASIFERDLFIVEVALSLNAAEDAAAYFRESVKTQIGPVRLSSAIILANLELLRRQHNAYAEIAFDSLIPALAGLPAEPQGDDTYVPVMMAGVLQMMEQPEFLADTPEKTRKDMVERWKKVRERADARLANIANSSLFFLAESLKDKELQDDCRQKLGLDTAEKENQFREATASRFTFIFDAPKR
jgi:hypothetical protein